MIRFTITSLILFAFFSVNIAHAEDKNLCDMTLEGVSVKNTHEEAKKIWEERGFVKEREHITPPLGLGGLIGEEVELMYTNITPKIWREGGGTQLHWYGAKDGQANTIKVVYLAVHQKSWNETRYYGRGQELKSKYCKGESKCNVTEDFVDKLNQDEYIKPGSNRCYTIFRSNARDHMEAIMHVP